MAANGFVWSYRVVTHQCRTAVNVFHTANMISLFNFNVLKYLSFDSKLKKKIEEKVLVCAGHDMYSNQPSVECVAADYFCVFNLGFVE